MREVVIGDRSITVTHIKTERTEHGDIQRYEVHLSGSGIETHMSSLRSSPAVDARVLVSVLDAELLLDWERSTGSGLLRDSATRAWRDQNRTLIQEALDRLGDEVATLPPEPVSDIERMLLQAFDAGDEADRD